MKIHLTRRAKARIVTFGIAGFALLWGFLLDARMSLSDAETHLEYVYRRSLGDLTDHVSNMQTTLQKAMYAGTANTRSAVSAELIEQSEGAKAAMAALPFSQEKAEGIDKFLSQVGDFALALSRRTLSGGSIEREDLRSLSTLREYAGKLCDSLTAIQARLTAEGDGIVHTRSLLTNLEAPAPLALLDSDISEVAEEFAGFPALLYDGPFSDHISRREPLYLRGRDTVSEAEARETAASLLDVPADELGEASQGGGRLPVFSFTCPQADGPEWDMVNITCQGGEVSYYKRYAEIPGHRMGYAQALDAAREYLRGLGYEDMRESYYLLNDGLCTINFHTQAETADGQQAICYPDLIKVVIELWEGGAVEFDAAGYLMNAHARDIPAPGLTEAEAAGNLSPYLRTDSAQLALIPAPGQNKENEVLCWEFHCTASDGQELLSYINASTGQEEQLYLIRRDEHGVLTV